MARPLHCSNHRCPHALSPPPRWLVRDGTYPTLAHGRVQRYRCRHCGTRLSSQTESIHYFSKLRLDLTHIFERIRGGGSMRDIGRSLGCSRSAVANAALRLGRQAMAAHLSVVTGLCHSGRLCFDGLASAVCSRDYPSQITTLGDSQTELLLAMTHCVSERGGTRTVAQQRRIARHRRQWRPTRGALSSSIALLVKELPRFASLSRLHLDTDKHPLYPKVLAADRAIRWYREARLFTHRRTSSTAARTHENPLFLVNYIDRMIRHRVKEHTRESIAIARNATMQMHRMWIFAWDHNAVQPHRVSSSDSRSRAERAIGDAAEIGRLRAMFFSRRIPIRRPVPESMRAVWCATLESPPVRWRAAQRSTGLRIPGYAKRDLARGYLQAA